MESGFATLTEVRKVDFNTNRSTESGFATITQVSKVVLLYEHKCWKWFCIASTSVESGFATLTEVRKVDFNTNRSAKSGFAAIIQVGKVVLHHQHKCGK